MYGYPFYVPGYPPFPAFIMPNSQYRFSYPAVDPKIFAQSVRSFRLLMGQGSRLLDGLSDPDFSKKIMEAAQQGKKRQVEMLIKSLDLRVPITTQYNPSGVIFTLHSTQDQHSPEDCCTFNHSIEMGPLKVSACQHGWQAIFHDQEPILSQSNYFLKYCDFWYDVTNKKKKKRSWFRWLRKPD